MDDNWYSDGVWDDVYDSSFALSGTSTDDPDWWGTVKDLAGKAWDVANSEAGSSFISGATGGLLSYYSEKGQREAYNKRTDADIARIAAHNASISKAPAKPKQVRFNG